MSDSDSDDDYVESDHGSSATAANSSNRQLNIYRMEERVVITFDTMTLHNMIHQGQINLNPEYQRDVVWSEKQQSLLIDSLIRNFYIPPVIFAVHTEQGSRVRTCLDGKQRLTSIQRFIDGEIPWRCKEDKKTYYYQQPPGSKHRVLPPNLQAMFAGSYVQCMELKGLTDPQERETFQRVQNGKELKKDEKLQALTGKHPDLASKVLRRYMVSFDGINNKLPWAHDRSKDYRITAEAIYRLAFLPFYKGKIQSFDQWVADSDTGPVPKEKETLAMNTFDLFHQLANNKEAAEKLNRFKTLAPVEVIMIPVFISRFMDKMTMTTMVEGIDQMRIDLRGKFKDVRNNEKLRGCMDTFMKSYQPPALGPGETPMSALLSRKRKRDDSPEGASLSKILSQKIADRAAAKRVAMDGSARSSPSPSTGAANGTASVGTSTSAPASTSSTRPPGGLRIPRLGVPTSASASVQSPSGSPATASPVRPFSAAMLASQAEERQDIKLPLRGPDGRLILEEYVPAARSAAFDRWRPRPQPPPSNSSAPGSSTNS